MVGTAGAVPKTQRPENLKFGCSRAGEDGVSAPEKREFGFCVFVLSAPLGQINSIGPHRIRVDFPYSICWSLSETPLRHN